MDHRCPRCDVALGPPDGAGEQCPSCGGHHLDVELSGPLLEREVGRSIDELKTIASHFAGERLLCPGCGGAQSPVTLRGVPVDLCLGCGALWLDAGELSQLTRGRIEEGPPPKRDVDAPRERPLAASPTPPPPTSKIDLTDRPLPRGLGWGRGSGIALAVFGGFMGAMVPHHFMAPLLIGGGVIRALLNKSLRIVSAEATVEERVTLAGLPLPGLTTSVPLSSVTSVYVEKHVRRTKNGSYDAYRVNVMSDLHVGALHTWDARTEWRADEAAEAIRVAAGLSAVTHRTELLSSSARRAAR